MESLLKDMSGFFNLKKNIKLALIGMIAGVVSGFFSTGGGLILVFLGYKIGTLI